MENKPLLKDLRVLKQQRADEAARIALAIELDICPVCGSDIIEEKVEVHKPPSKVFFGLITINHQTLWDSRKVCKENKDHYELKSNNYTYENHDSY